MKCEQASEITAYLHGEGSEEERAMLRRHFEQCESCARELAQFERAFGALGKVETIEPSAGFQQRVEAAFLRAHPQFGAAKPKFRLLRAASIAAGFVIIAVGALILLTFIAKAGKDDRLANVSPEIIPDDDPEYRTLPKTNLPTKIDASAWGEALAYDQRLVAAAKAPRSGDAALKWLAARQETDGSWKGASADETIELTALSVLALGPVEEHGLAVRKGLSFLKSRQRDSGAVGGGSPESHAIATLALQEAALRTGQGGLNRAAAKAVGVIAQQNHDGPWGKGMVAGWHYHVLRLAVASGDRALTAALVLGHEALHNGGRREIQSQADMAATARAELWTEPKPDLKGWESEVGWLLERSPLLLSKNDLRLAYFGSALLAQIGGDAWTKWWSPLQSKLQKTQSADGSWPEGFEQGKSQVYVTALCALILQTPSRIPPLDQ
jgi:hypothetical protein